MTIAVVGAGIIGAACAFALRRDGHDVVLLDPAPPGSGTSAGNAGHIAIDHVRPLARPDVLAGVPRMLANPRGPLTLRWRGVPAMTPWFARFAAAARPARMAAGTAALAGLLAQARPEWVSLLAAAGLSDMLRTEGALVVYETAAGRAAAVAEGRIQRAHGVTFQDLSPAETTDLLPGLVATPAGGRLFPDAAHVVQPRRLVEALVRCFVAEGGSLRPVPVGGFEIADGRLVALRLPEGALPVAAAVLTAGLGSPRLAGGLGVRLPMTAERGYHAMLPIGALPVRLPSSFAERGFVATPMEHGLRLAGTVEFGAGGRPPDWARAEILVEHVRALFGRDVRATESWQGDRPTLPDYLPAIGAVPGVQGAFIATGHQHLGLTLAAVTAGIVGRMIRGGGPGVPDAFDPGRF